AARLVLGRELRQPARGASRFLAALSAGSIAPVSGDRYPILRIGHSVSWLRLAEDAAVRVELDAEVPEQALVVAAQPAHAQRSRVRAAQDVAEHRHAGIAQLVDRSEVQDHFLGLVFLDQLALEKERAGGIEPAGD